MIVPILIATVGIFSASGKSSNNWVVQMMHSPEVKAVLAENERQNKLHPVLQNQGMIIIDDPESHLLLDFSAQQMKDLRETTDLVRNFLKTGQYSQAYKYTSEVKRSHVPWGDFLQGETIEAEIATGHNQEAFLDTVVAISSNINDENYSFEGDNHLLALSISGAALGYVAKGETRYCQEQLIQGLKENASTISVPISQDELEPDKLYLLGCLAFGVRQSPAILHYVISLDPENEIANKILIGQYVLKGQYSEARKLAEAAIAHLPAGELSDYYSSQLKSIEGKSDRLPAKPEAPKPEGPQP